MPKIFSEQGFEFWLYTNDHPPAHSHVFRGKKIGRGKKAEVLLYLGKADGAPALREVRGMRKQDVRKALSIAGQRQAELLAAWEEIYGA